jgi:formylglycine-generating enzyme required for sulfatase activity
MKPHMLVLAALLQALPAVSRADAPPHAAGTFTIEAKDLDAGNVRVSLTGQSYADGPSCIWHGSGSPDRAEYVIEFPITADYTLSSLYTAQDSRPVAIGLDGKAVHTGLAGVTGSWQTSSARWERQCTLYIARGTHTLSLEREGPLPHICALRLESSLPFPAGWTLKRLSPEQRAERARLAERQARVRAQVEAIRRVDPEAVRLAIDDLESSFPGRYDGPKHWRALAEFVRVRQALAPALETGELPGSAPPAEALLAGVRAALLANPLLDFDRLLVVRRRPADSTGFVPANYLSHASIVNRTGWDNEIAVLSGLRGRPRWQTLYRPEGGRLLRDVRLEFDAQRLLFSSIDEKGRWAVYEMPTAGGKPRQVSPTSYPDLDFFDACYLPDGRIVVASTANYQGVPCLNGGEPVATLYLLDPATGKLRQLTFDQDHGNDPTVLNDGRVLYQRWEYSDIPHYFARRRMSMNPDGTGQLALHGSNSWFPTAFRFAQPIPDHPTLLAGIISGHHDHGDCGRLALLDPGLAGGYPFRFRPTSKEWGTEGEHVALTPDVLPTERTGFVQLVPGRGKPVAGTVCDDIVSGHYLKHRPELMTHPLPLSRKYFLVSMKPAARALWGIYLVDVFDNMTLIAEEEGSALFEPLPLRPRKRPPVIPDRVDPRETTVTVHIADVHAGSGLKGVPRGTVKALRVFSYHFGYPGKAGFEYIGTQAGWDVKRVLGTATVEPDGSAAFTIPANTPVSIQPLDGEGRAVQLMRSWLVGMPGERVSCVGCHENRAETLPLRQALADRRAPEPLTPWYGPARPFAFASEVYPVLRRHCVGCHDGRAEVGPRSKPSFTGPDVAYDTLHPYVHRPRPEADIALLNPMEFHASTSPLIQMLEKGHHGVRLADLPRESRERLYCWIDLNVPRHGSFEPPATGQDLARRRCELSKLFAGTAVDPEREAGTLAEARRTAPPVAYEPPPKPADDPPDTPQVAGFPFDRATAVERQRRGPGGGARTMELGPGVTMLLRWIPPGSFVMGRRDGAPDERPRTVVRIAEPFWMAETEVTNGQYALFDPEHDTRYVDMHYMDRVTPGYIANHPDQPVARVSWQEAMGFCAWLSRKTGLHATLPTEAQWEWAARAGTDTPFFYGTIDTDFGRFANLADRSLRWFQMGYPGPGNLQTRSPYPSDNNFPLRDERFVDRSLVVDYVGRTAPNAWGLKDTVGNVSEWTRSTYRRYPYAAGVRVDSDPGERKVARGGSWADRPADAGSSVRRAYAAWQKVHDVGFRVIVEDLGHRLADPVPGSIGSPTRVARTR